MHVAAVFATGIYSFPGDSVSMRHFNYHPVSIL